MSIAPFTTNEALDQKATLGLIVLKADESIETDFRKLVPEDVALHVSRIKSGDEVTAETLITMKDQLTASASLFADSSRFDCIGYACTSGTSVIGMKEVAVRIKAGCDTAHVTDPVTALIAACKKMDVKRLGVLSPYVPDISASLRDVLADNRIETPELCSFDEADEAKVARIDEGSIINASVAVAKNPGIEALFISCTNLRSLAIIEHLEDQTGLPVLTSNQVLAWHMSVLAKTELKPGPFGRLMIPNRR